MPLPSAELDIWKDAIVSALLGPGSLQLDVAQLGVLHHLRSLTIRIWPEIDLGALSVRSATDTAWLAKRSAFILIRADTVEHILGALIW
jgi:hypothetical protein